MSFFRPRKGFGTFEKRAPEIYQQFIRLKMTALTFMNFSKRNISALWFKLTFHLIKYSAEKLCQPFEQMTNNRGTAAFYEEKLINLITI